MIYFILYFDQVIVEHNRAEKSRMINDIKQQQQKQDKMMNEKDQHIDRSIEVNLIIVFGVSVLIHNSVFKFVSFSCACRLINTVDEMTEHNRAEMNEKDQHIDRSIEVNLIIMFGVSVLIHNSVFMFVSFSCACRLINTVDEMTEVADNRDALDTQVEI